MLLPTIIVNKVKILKHLSLYYVCYIVSVGC